MDVHLTKIDTNPIGSMYAIYGNIYHQYPQMLACIPYMDPMGIAFDPFSSLTSVLVLIQENSFKIRSVFPLKLPFFLVIVAVDYPSIRG